MSQSLLTQAWDARLNRDMPRFLEIYMQIQREGDHGGCDTELLRVSFLRWQGQLAEAETTLKQLRERLISANQTPPTRYHLECGLTHLVQSRYFLALEEFIKCAPGDGDLDVQVQLNTLIALEALSMPLDRVEARLAELFQRPRPSGLLDQWQAFRLRQAFRRGDFAEIAWLRPNPGSQAEFFRAWTLALPYHAHRTKGELSVEATSQMFSLSYRMRTLAGLTHPEDDEMPKVSEKVDRLYLWTWFWLRSPDDFALRKLAQLMEGMKTQLETHNLSYEEQLMLRNALLWISLFDPRAHDEIRQYLRRFNFARESSGLPLLQLEYLFVSYALCARDGQTERAGDFLRLLKAHPLWGQKDLCFAELLGEGKGESEGQAEGYLVPLANRLRELLRRDHAPKPGQLRVDLSRHLLWRADSRLASEAACRALVLLNQRSQVTASEFLSYVYGIEGYDELPHAAKIHNLLARVRRHLPPTLKMGFRAGRVAAAGSWKDVEWHGQNSWQESIDRESTFRLVNHVRDEQKDSGSKFVLPHELEAIGQQSFSRRDLERQLRRPRATVNRMLARWIRAGWVRAQGRARTTKYIVIAPNGGSDA